MVVEIVDGECSLGEPVEDLCLSEIFAFFLHLFDLGVHVPQLTVHHDDAEVTVSISEAIFVGDDVDVPEFLQDLELVFDVLSFLLLYFECLYPLEGVVVIFLRLVLAQEYVSRGPACHRPYPVPISFPISYSSILSAIKQPL